MSRKATRVPEATVLLVGVGHLGGPLLDRISVQPGVERVIVCSPSAVHGRARVNLARVNAALYDRRPRIEHHVVDLRDRGRLAVVVRETLPDVAVHAASVQTWWVLDALPPAAAGALREAGFAAWLPIHLDLAMDFMRELGAVGYDGTVLNAAYPDVVNVILSKLDRAPTCGIGNVDEIAAKIALLAGEQLGADLAAIDVTLVAHHAVEAIAFRSAPGVVEVPPHFLRIEHEGRDVTAELDGPRLLSAAFPLPPGPSWGSFTATSGARLIARILAANESKVHAPGPFGRPGGYPVMVGAGGVGVAEIAGLTLDEAVRINRAAQPFDGVEDIDDDGGFVLSERSDGILQDQLGYIGRRVKPADVAAKAAELSVKLGEFAARHGVDLDRVTGATR